MDVKCEDGRTWRERGQWLTLPCVLGCCCLMMVALVSIFALFTVYITAPQKTGICPCMNSANNFKKEESLNVRQQEYNNKGTKDPVIPSQNPVIPSQNPVIPSQNHCQPVSWLETCKTCFNIMQDDA
ncbi:uncharacterized protein LOC144619170 [Crassostrea virginica]